MAEFLIQRHTWFVGWNMTTATCFYFTSHSISISGTHTRTGSSVTTNQHNFMNLIQSRASTPRNKDALLIFQDDTIEYVMFTKLTVHTDFLIDEPIKESRSTNALQTCSLVRVVSDLISFFAASNGYMKLQHLEESEGRRAKCYSDEQTEERLTGRTSPLPV